MVHVCTLKLKAYFGEHFQVFRKHVHSLLFPFCLFNQSKINLFATTG